MRHLKYIIVHKKDCEPEELEEHKEHKGHEGSERTGFESIISKSQAANALESMKGYAKYTKKHGHHFTEALAEYASKMMQNANGETHSWTAAQVKKAFEGLGLPTASAHATAGDITYAANMLYADLYPEAVKDEVSCLKGAYKMANDPDGYEGMIFIRWTSDVISKAIDLDWEKFI